MVKPDFEYPLIWIVIIIGYVIAFLLICVIMSHVI